MQRAKTIRGWVGRGGLDDVSRVSVVALAPRPAAAAVLGGPLRRSHATFVNRGLRLWELQRQQWLQPVLDERGVPIPVVKRRAVNVDVARVERIVRNQNKKATLPCPVPLPQMIDITTEIWEDEGLYDRS